MLLSISPHFVFAQSVDAVLWVVAVHDGDIVAFHVVEVAGGECRDGGFADATFCVANATKISLLMVLFILIVDDLFFCFHADLAVALSASVITHIGGSSRIRFCGEAVRRTSDE